MLEFLTQVLAGAFVWWLIWRAWPAPALTDQRPVQTQVHVRCDAARPVEIDMAPKAPPLPAVKVKPHPPEPGMLTLKVTPFPPGSCAWCGESDAKHRGQDGQLRCQFCHAMAAAKEGWNTHA